jgi:hypothetical protein
MKSVELTIRGEPETSFQAVTAQQLERMIMELLPNYDGEQSWYFDNLYYALPVWRLGEVLAWWWKVLDQVNYLPEAFDCDDYAKLFSSLLACAQYNAAGIVIGELYYRGRILGYHAWNLLLFVNRQGQFKVYEFEPQTANVLVNHKSLDGFEYVGRWVIW